MQRIRVLAIVSSLFVSFAFATAQSSDWHLSNEGARAFFLRSPFAHGYMHGYESGFHHGDLDLQMGRAFQEIKKQTSFKKMEGYHGEFGDRRSFEEGYRKGYTVGYTDSYSGRSFRAIQLVQQAKSDNLSDGSAVPDSQFNSAFVSGYAIGQKTGLQDGRAAAAVAALNSIDCGSGAPAAGDDCSAYRGGYRLGYSDGYVNQHRELGEIFASK